MNTQQLKEFDESYKWSADFLEARKKHEQPGWCD